MARLETKKYGVNLDMVHGPLLSRLAVFSVPIILSGLLQLLFNAADIAVVGRYTGSDALAAVGASSPIASFIVSMFMGLSVGANVLCAQYRGAGQDKDLSETVHTSIAISVGLGVAMTVVGVLVAGSLLNVVKTPENIFPLAKQYLCIYFCGIPSIMVYNFGAAVLRAIGDTRRPMYFLIVSGALNVLLNLLFVIVFGMGVAGVAIATVISQTLAAVFVILAMMRTSDVYRLELKRLRIHKDKLSRLMKIGIPAGIQGSAFSISNILIQSAINSFGENVMAATTIANNIDSFCYVAIDALAQASISFTGQNYGAGNYKRIDKIFAYTLGIGCVIALVLGVGAYLLAPQLLSIYTKDPAVIEVGIEIMFIVCVFEIINCTMNIPFNIVRGMNRSFFPMISTIICVCVFRVVWVYTIFRYSHTVTTLFLSWPVSKGVASVTGIVYYFWLRKKIGKQHV